MIVNETGPDSKLGNCAGLKYTVRNLESIVVVQLAVVTEACLGFHRAVGVPVPLQYHQHETCSLSNN